MRSRVRSRVRRFSRVVVAFSSIKIAEILWADCWTEVSARTLWFRALHTASEKSRRMRRSSSDKVVRVRKMKSSDVALRRIVMADLLAFLLVRIDTPTTLGRRYGDVKMSPRLRHILGSKERDLASAHDGGSAKRCVLAGTRGI